MGLSDKEMKDRLRRKSEEVIEELVSRKRGASEITLSEIEELVREAGEALKQAMTEELVKQVSQAEPEVPGPACERCGKEMHYKGMKSKHVIAETGEVDVERAYYYCETCKSGIFPPGQEMEIE
jgi:hypothetical protein